MREPEQMTVNEVLSGNITLADLAIYGGLIGVGVVLAIWLLRK